MNLENWLLFWEIVEGLGTAIVAVCCTVEYLTEFKKIPKDETKRHKYAKQATLWLVMGLVVELFAHGVSSHISGLQTAKLNKEAEQANERAGIAQQQAAQSSERAERMETTNLVWQAKVAVLESNNLALRSNVVVLEDQVQWREISPAQEKIIVDLLQTFTQRSAAGTNQFVVVRVGETTDHESLRYAKQIADILRGCGFLTYFVAGSSGYSQDDGLEFIVADRRNTPIHARAIVGAFGTAKIESSILAYPQLGDTNELMILVLPKPRK